MHTVLNVLYSPMKWVIRFYLLLTALPIRIIVRVMRVIDHITRKTHMRCVRSGKVKNYLIKTLILGVAVLEAPAILLIYVIAGVTGRRNLLPYHDIMTTMKVRIFCHRVACGV